eukprot:577926-Pelagomonas_calceolata.AAC.13
MERRGSPGGFESAQTARHVMRRNSISSREGRGGQHYQAGPGEASTSRTGGQGGGRGPAGARRDHAANSRARRASVEFTPQPALLHRDVNAAWNLWEVGMAMYAGVARPAYLTPHTLRHSRRGPSGALIDMLLCWRNTRLTVKIKGCTFIA